MQRCQSHLNYTTPSLDLNTLNKNANSTLYSVIKAPTVNTAPTITCVWHCAQHTHTHTYINSLSVHAHTYTHTNTSTHLKVKREHWHTQRNEHTQRLLCISAGSTASSIIHKHIRVYMCVRVCLCVCARVCWNVWESTCARAHVEACLCVYIQLCVHCT